MNMNKTAVVSARIRPDIKEESEKVLRTLGLSTTDAITLLFNQIALKQGMPFPVEIPNKVTQRVIDEVDRGEGLTRVNSMEEFKKAMNS
jgi:DNA-damage-inducible protein J